MFTGKPASGQKARDLVQKGALLYDTRDPVSYRDLTLPGAKNLALRQVSSLQTLSKDQVLVFFGLSAQDTTLSAVVNYAIQMGFKSVYVLPSMEQWFAVTKPSTPLKKKAGTVVRRKSPK